MERPKQRGAGWSFHLAGLVGVVTAVGCVDLSPPWSGPVDGTGGIVAGGGSGGGAGEGYGGGGNAGGGGGTGAPGTGQDAAAGGTAGSSPSTDGGEPRDAELPAPPVLTVRWHYDGAALSWQAGDAYVRFQVLGAPGEDALQQLATDLTGRELIDDDAVGVGTTYRYVVEGRTATGVTVRSNVARFTRTPNLLGNPSFELGGVATQTPASWGTWAPATSAPGASADYTEAKGGARSGTFHATHFDSGQDWSIFTLQKLMNVPAGRYGVRAFFRSSGDARASQLVLKHCGSDIALTMAPVPASPSTWTEIGVEGDLKSDQCYEVGVYTEGVRNAFVHFDDVAAFRILP